MGAQLILLGLTQKAQSIVVLGFKLKVLIGMTIMLEIGSVAHIQSNYILTCHSLRNGCTGHAYIDYVLLVSEKQGF